MLPHRLVLCPAVLVSFQKMNQNHETQDREKGRGGREGQGKEEGG